MPVPRSARAARRRRVLRPIALVLLVAAPLAVACRTRDHRPADTATATTRRDSTVSGDTLWLLASDPAVDAVHATDDESALVRRYGRANVVRDSLPGPEGESFEGTVLFPHDPKRTLYVYWDDSLPFQRATDLRTGDEATAWVVWPGVTVGTTLAEVERLNGRPFTLNGFGFDYGGLVLDWQRGRLDSLWHPRGKSSKGWVGIQFGPGHDVAAVEREGEFSSALPAMRAADPRVGMLTITVR